jgi:hypothetical protein
LPEATKLPIESISWLYEYESCGRSEARWMTTIKDTGCLRVLRPAACRDDDDDAQSGLLGDRGGHVRSLGSRDKGTCIGYSDEYS